MHHIHAVAGATNVELVAGCCNHRARSFFCYTAPLPTGRLESSKEHFKKFSVIQSKKSQNHSTSLEGTCSITTTFNRKHMPKQYTTALTHRHTPLTIPRTK